MSNLDITCEYCGAGTSLLVATVPDHVSAMEWRKAWKQNAASFKRITCPSCGGAFGLQDDGVDAEQGGMVERMNMSSPRIDSINVSSGPRTGGGNVFLAGEALDIGETLTVKFGGKPATQVDQRTSTQARVLVPPATYTLNESGRAIRLAVTPVLGDLEADEPVVSPAGSTGTIWLIENLTCWVHFDSIAEADVGLVGVSFTGSNSGAVATVNAVNASNFAPGELALGLSSGVQAVVRTDRPLVVDSPSGGFAPSELVRGVGSMTVAKLSASPAYSGTVDVTVENDYGQRAIGGALLGAYTYA